MAGLSNLVECSDFVKTVATELNGGKASAGTQQSFARTLGGLDYGAFDHGVSLAVKILVNCLDEKVSPFNSRYPL